MASDRIGVVDMSERLLLYIVACYVLPVAAFASGWRAGGRRFFRTQIYVLLSYVLILHVVQLLVDDCQTSWTIPFIISVIFLAWFGTHGEVLRKEQAKQRSGSDEG